MPVSRANLVSSVVKRGALIFVLTALLVLAVTWFNGRLTWSVVPALVVALLIVVVAIAAGSYWAFRIRSSAQSPSLPQSGRRYLWVLLICGIGSLIVAGLRYALGEPLKVVAGTAAVAVLIGSYAAYQLRFGTVTSRKPAK